MGTTAGLMTVAEFVKLPERASGARQELHHGQVVELPPVKKLHNKCQRRLCQLLAAALERSEFEADKEFPFRPTAEHEVWVADVAVFAKALWQQTPDDDYFQGVPAIVVEVLSPSNDPSDMLDREDTCLRNGGREFWIVDARRHTVKAIHSDGRSKMYHAPETLESPILGSNAIAVSAIFQD